MSSKIGQFTKYSINSILTQFFFIVTSTLTAIITSRILGPEGKGKLSLILLIPLLSVTFGRMGVGHAVNYYANKTHKTNLIINSFILSVIISISLLGITLITVIFTGNIFFKDIDKNLIIFISWFVPLYVLQNHFACLLQGFYDIDGFNLVSIIQSISNLILLIILIIILKYNLKGAVISSISSIVLSVIVSVVLLLKKISLKDIKFDYDLIKKLISFGLKSHIGNILKDLSYRGDILIISYYLSSIYVGYYMIAVTIAEIIWKIPDAIGSVLLPKISQMDSNKAKSFTPIVCRIVFFTVLILCFFLFLFNKQLILIAFGDKFLFSSEILTLLLPGILAFTVWKILANDLIAQGYPSKYSLTSGIALLTMVFFDFLLIPKFGIKGAAIASSFSYIFATIAIVFIYLRLTGNFLKDLIIPIKSDFIFLMNFKRSKR